MKPRAWSPSRLDDFINCPKAFHAKSVAKTHVDAGGPWLAEGLRVHKAFELRQRDGAQLPPDLKDHEQFMLMLEGLPGLHFAERPANLTQKLIDCDTFDDDVWMRSVIDFTVVDGRYARVIDYKTGKQHAKFRQLLVNALYIFTTMPDVDRVACNYYWTKTQTTNGIAFKREDLVDMWGSLLPDLKQWAEAFKYDVWQPRQSGLCHGYCPVEECQFWRPRKDKR